MLPLNRAAVVLRCAAYGTVTPVDVIQRTSGVSRTWSRTAADRLSEQGFLVREFLPRVGPGRPTVGYRLTRPGEKFLESVVEAEASRFKPGTAVAGPTWTLAEYGVPFTGPKDAFVAAPQGFAALQEVEAPTYLVESPVERHGILVPSPDRLVLWLMGSGDERNVLAAPVVMRRHVTDWPRLWRMADHLGMRNRLAYVLNASGQGDKIPQGFAPATRPEQLVAFGETDPEQGKQFNVAGTVPPARFREFETLYGSP